MTYFVPAWEELENKAHDIARKNGFWSGSVNVPEKLALIHAEVSECLEALRKDNPSDKHLPHRSSAEVELADVVIRIMDLAYAMGWDVAGAITDKIQFNETRPYKHGKEF